MNFRTLIGLVGLALILSLSSAASADTYTYNVVTGNGLTATFADFTSNGKTIVAYGSVNGVGADLWFKNGGGSETGLGLAVPINHEIGGNSFIQFDISQLLAVHPTSLTLSIGSVSSGESYSVWGSNSFSLSDKGTFLGTSSSPMFSVPGFAGYKFISISAASGNVLITGVTAKTDVPEPGSSSLIIAGLMSIVAAGMFFRRGVTLGPRHRMA
jgi:hypothetical protein